MVINEATGEVTATIGGATFRFHATIGRMGELEAQLGAKNAGEIIAAINDVKIRDTVTAFGVLCTSGNAAALHAMPFGKVVKDVSLALISAIAAYLPAADEDEGRTEKNGEAAPASAPTGADGERSPSAS